MRVFRNVFFRFEGFVISVFIVNKSRGGFMRGKISWIILERFKNFIKYMILNIVNFYNYLYNNLL